MDNVVILLLCICGGILAASQHKMRYDDEILAEIRQSLREDMKAEIQEIMEHSKVQQDKVLTLSHTRFKEEITFLRMEMGTLKTEIISLKRDLEDKTNEIVTLQDETNALKGRIMTLQDEARTDVGVVKGGMMPARNVDYETNMQQKDGQIIIDNAEDDIYVPCHSRSIHATERASGIVAFSASRTTELGPVSEDTTITYDFLELNVGSGFEPSTGTFTVPVTGLYLLHMGMMGDNVVVYYMINQDKYRAVKTGQAPEYPYATGSTAAIVQLNAGDLVKTQLVANAGSYQIHCGTGGTCYMGGYLLYQTI